MADIVAVLVVPVEGDPGGLLAAGLCGATPPICYSPIGSIDRAWLVGRGGRSGPSALPLWWGGSLVPEGWDRAVRVGDGRRLRNPWLPQVLELADKLVREGFASCVVRLARVDDRLVEL